MMTVLRLFVGVESGFCQVGIKSDQPSNTAEVQRQAPTTAYLATRTMALATPRKADSVQVQVYSGMYCVLSELYLATSSMTTPRKADRLSSQCSNHSLDETGSGQTPQELAVQAPAQPQPATQVPAEPQAPAAQATAQSQPAAPDPGVPAPAVLPPAVPTPAAPTPSYITSRCTNNSCTNKRSSYHLGCEYSCTMR